MTNELHNTDENTGTMEVLERHQFDVSKLKDYMHENVEGFEGEIEVEEFKGGQSNPTYKVITPKQSYVLRRKPPRRLSSENIRLLWCYNFISRIRLTAFKFFNFYFTFKTFNIFMHVVFEFAYIKLMPLQDLHSTRIFISIVKLVCHVSIIR